MRFAGCGMGRIAVAAVAQAETAGNNDAKLHLNKKKVRGWIRQNSRLYDNASLLAEAVAEALDMYDNHTDCSIPGWVIDIANEALLRK